MFFIATTQIDNSQCEYDVVSTIDTETSPRFNKNILNQNFNDVMVVYKTDNVDFSLNEDELTKTLNFISTDSFDEIWSKEEDNYWENYM